MIGRAGGAIVLAGLLVAAGLGAGAGLAADPPRPLMTSAQSDYVEHCGGCHGIQGSSLPARVPPLRDRVGYFMCTKAGRAYLLRLPNVALSPTDDAQLADIMNFVVFRLGGASTGTKVLPYTAAEVGLERQHKLTSASLIAERARITRDVSARCKVPKAALQF
jgi:hypothetical protein